MRRPPFPFLLPFFLINVFELSCEFEYSLKCFYVLIKSCDHARKRTEQLLPNRSRFCRLPRHKGGQCASALPPPPLLLLLAFDEGFVLKELRSRNLLQHACCPDNNVVHLLRSNCRQEALAKETCFQQHSLGCKQQRPWSKRLVHS